MLLGADLAADFTNSTNKILQNIFIYIHTFHIVLHYSSPFCTAAVPVTRHLHNLGAGKLLWGRQELATRLSLGYKSPALFLVYVASCQISKLSAARISSDTMEQQTAAEGSFGERMGGIGLPLRGTGLPQTRSTLQAIGCQSLP